MLINLLKSPVVQFLLTLLVAYISYLATRDKEVEPSFSISNPVLVAKSTANIPDFQLIWKNKIISNLYRQKVVIFNNGKDYIDKEKVSKTNPIRIVFNKKNNLLSYSVTKTSRESLSFSLKKEVTENNIIISADFINDDALEYKDGFIVTLFFTGDPKLKVNVLGGVKGRLSEGFTKVDWWEISTGNSTEVYKNLFLTFSITFFLVIFMLKDVNKVAKGKKIQYLFSKEGLPLLAIITIIFAMMGSFIIQQLNTIEIVINELPWLNK